MKLSITQMNVILDTMIGSLQIKDGGMIFNYESQDRRNVANYLLNEMNELKLPVTMDKENP